jgi:hypothetical protein
VAKAPWLVVFVLVLGASTRAEPPAFNYVLHCQGCHLADGAGTPGSGIPALAGSVGRFVRVPEGREYLTRVPGVAQSPLDDAALAELLNWVLHHFSAAELPADFVPYTAEEIGRGRRLPLTDVEGVRRRLLETFAK